jgi:hypothetical protein
MASDFVSSALASAHKALSDANNSSVGTKSGHSGITPSKPAASPAKSDYSHARAARPGGESFMGVKADQGPELKAANESHDNAVKALNQ